MEQKFEVKDRRKKVGPLRALTEAF